jgi:hypothetical protein
LFISLGYLGCRFLRKTYDFSTLGVGGLESGKVHRKVPRKSAEKMCREKCRETCREKVQRQSAEKMPRVRFSFEKHIEKIRN